MQKVSKRQIVREAQKMYDENRNLKREANTLLQMLFGVCVKLYKISPDDEVFANSFKPDFLSAIKKAASEDHKADPEGVAEKPEVSPEVQQ